MSYLEARNALLQPLIDLIPTAETELNALIGLHHEGTDFDPSGYELYLSQSFIPATTEPLGKAVTDKDDDRGFMQVSIYYEQNRPTVINKALQLSDIIGKTFYNTACLNGVTVTEFVLGGQRISESWLVRDITINYVTYTTRI